MLAVEGEALTLNHTFLLTINKWLCVWHNTKECFITWSFPSNICKNNAKISNNLSPVRNLLSCEYLFYVKYYVVLRQFSKWTICFHLSSSSLLMRCHLLFTPYQNAQGTLVTKLLWCLVRQKKCTFLLLKKEQKDFHLISLVDPSDAPFRVF